MTDIYMSVFIAKSVKIVETNLDCRCALMESVSINSIQLWCS
jgi:hypothetical protein